MIFEIELSKVTTNFLHIEVMIEPPKFGVRTKSLQQAIITEKPTRSTLALSWLILKTREKPWCDEISANHDAYNVNERGNSLCRFEYHLHK